jgi:hypothetical protein
VDTSQDVYPESSNNSQHRQFSDHSSFAPGQKQNILKNSDAAFASSTGRKSKGIPTFNQFSSAAHGVTNFGAAAAAGLQFVFISVLNTKSDLLFERLQ